VGEEIQKSKGNSKGKRRDATDAELTQRKAKRAAKVTAKTKAACAGGFLFG